MKKQAAYLVLKAGSSSLKLSDFRQNPSGGELHTILTGQISGIGENSPQIQEILVAKHTIHVLSQNRGNA